MSADPRDPDFHPWPSFTAALRELVPELPPEAVVYAVDAISQTSPRTRLTAGIVRNGRLVGKATSRLVDKAWLAEFDARHAGMAKPSAPPEPADDGAGVSP